MTAIIQQTERGGWTVRYYNEVWVGTYTAQDEADALDFAASPERQARDRAFALAKFRAKIGRP